MIQRSSFAGHLASAGMALMIALVPRAVASQTSDSESILPIFDDAVFSHESRYAGWWIKAIGAEAGWAITPGQEEIVISIVDDGILLSHEEFLGKIALQGSWHSQDGSFIEEDFFNDSYLEHGTPVAAMAAGRGGNGVGSLGVCPACLLMPLQVRLSLDGPTSGSVLWGLLYSLEHNASVVNLSLAANDYEEDLPERFYDPGTRRSAIDVFLDERQHSLDLGYSSTGDWPLHDLSYEDMLDIADQYGVLVVVGAGNDSMPADFQAFCYHPTTLCVGSVAQRVDGTITPSAHSNYGFMTQVSAPGTYIWTASADPSGQGYEWVLGTSFATPMVTGLAGLILSIQPDLKPRDLRQIIVATATPLSPEHDGENKFYAGGTVVEAEISAWRRAFLRILGKDETLLLDGPELKALVDIIPIERNGVWYRSQTTGDEQPQADVVCAQNDWTIEEARIAWESDGCGKAVGRLINVRGALELALAGGWQDRFATFIEEDFDAASQIDPAQLADLANEIFDES